RYSIVALSWFYRVSLSLEHKVMQPLAQDIEQITLMQKLFVEPEFIAELRLPIEVFGIESISPNQCLIV
ncbi:hypothetical protein DICVIV_13925, partial [Dictyocaulus viviparus]